VAPRGRRERVAEGLDRIGASRLVLAVRGRFQRWLTVVNYHRVSPPETPVPVDEGVVDATTHGFDAQVASLTRNFNLVGLRDVRGFFLEGRPLPPNPALITFDDGYRDCYTHALPILQRHGARAVFFVVTGNLTDRRLFWWDRIAWCVKHATQKAFVLRRPVVLEADMTRDGVARTTRNLLRIVKSHYDLDLEGFLEDLAGATGAPWDDALERKLAEELLMTWDDVRSLRQAGMEVSSHTHTHRVLETLPPERLMDDLVRSRQILERELGEPVRELAYPVGGPIAGIPHIRAAVAAAGYEMGFSYGTGVHSLRDLDPLDINRFSVERHFSASAFRAMLAFPGLIK
jgi:peptidoglycan/xylan/chitin deacetylase (PgdA/CDA1 family)